MISADAKLMDNIESLTRSAFINAINEDNDDTNIGLARCVEKHLLSGIAAGDLEPMTHAEFMRQLHDSLNQPMGGFFKKLKRTVKKVAKKSGISSLAKFAGKTVKKVATKTFKAVKKVAPYAAAGAAVYYGAPYLKKGGEALYNGAKNLIGGATSPALKEGKTIEGGALSKAAINKATNFATQLLTKEGVSMQSPQSQQMLQQYMAQQTPQYMPQPPQYISAPETGKYVPEKPPQTDLMKYALPAAGVVLTALLLK